VEGTGSFGYRLARYLLAHGGAVREVNRPDRARRRRVGKNDPLDAEHAARAVLAGDASAIPKNRDGVVGELRCLVVARRSAFKARTQATNQLRALLVGCDDTIRTRLRPLRKQHLARGCIRLRAAGPAQLALRSLGRRWLALDAEIGELDREITGLVTRVAPGSWIATASACTLPPSCSSPPATIRTGWPAKPLRRVVWHQPGRGVFGQDHQAAAQSRR
jgi:transposase